MFLSPDFLNVQNRTILYKSILNPYVHSRISSAFLGELSLIVEINLDLTCISI